MAESRARSDGDGISDRRSRVAHAVKLWVLGLCAVGALLGCGSPDSPEAQVRALMEQATEAAQDRDLAALRGWISDGYADAQGRSKRDVEDFLRAWFLRSQRLHVWTWVREISQQAAPPESAGSGRVRVELFAALASEPIEPVPLRGEASGQSAPEALRRLRDVRADVYRIELFLTASDAEWYVVEATWSPSRFSDLLPPQS